MAKISKRHKPKQQSIADYAQFIVTARINLGPRKHLIPRTKVSELPFHQPGLTNLLNTFAVGSPHSRKLDIEEWNPISQRPLFDCDKVDYCDFDGAFRATTHAIHHSIVLVHESIHVLMWESFFSGAFVPKSSNFCKLSLAFEGFCFWYADIILNRRIKIKSPDGEFVFKRHSASQNHVHPYHVFQALNVMDPEKIMRIYIDAFTGYETPISKNMNKPLVNEIANRFYGFYSDTLKAPVEMFKVLDDVQIFGEYFEKFCKIQNIPSMFSKTFLKTDPSQNLNEYCWAIFSKEMPRMDSLGSVQIRAVRLRRSLQTRAYFAFALRHSIERSNYIAKPGLSKKQMQKNINLYVEQLRVALNDLCEAQSHSKVIRSIEHADRFYLKNIRSRLIKYNAYCGRRLQLLPTFPGYSTLAINDKRTHLSRRQLLKFSQHLIDTLVVPNLDLVGKSADSLTLLRSASALTKYLASLQNLKGKKYSSQVKNISTKIDKILSHKLVLPYWSIPLSDIRPDQNAFREIIFKYR